jgi:hypothetical protein
MTADPETYVDRFEEFVKAHGKIAQDTILERIAQEIKWGHQEHHGERWLAILAEEFGEAARGVVETSTEATNAELANLRQELIQIAAVSWAWVQDWDVRELWSGT